MRVTGSGNLQLTLQSYDEIQSSELEPVVMEAATNKTPTRLANFTQQTAKLRIETIEMNEVFNISQILIYVKPTGTEFPS